MASFPVQFFYVIGEKRKELALMLFIFLLSSCLEVLSVGMVGPFVAIATNQSLITENQWSNQIYTTLNFSSSNQFVLFLGIVLVIAFYGKAGLAFSIQKFIFEFGFYLRRDLTSRLMRAYLSAPYTFHLSSNSAVLINNTVNETQSFCSGLLMSLLTSISNISIAFALVLLLMKTDLLATILISIVLFTAFLLFYQLRGKLYLWGKNASDANDDIIRAINHGLGGIKETRIIGCESYFVKQLENHATFYAYNVSAILSFNNLPRFMIEALLMTFLVSFTLLFITLNRGSENLISVLSIFALASIRLVPAASNVLSSLGTIRSTTVNLNRLYFDLKQLENYPSVSAKLPKSNGFKEIYAQQEIFEFKKEICIEHVTYRYPSAANDSLRDLSLIIKKGESIGLIGRSGAGKTTLVDVILGLLSPQSGEILVDGISARKNLRAWQNMLGYVPQSIFLIDDTMERNIAFGVPDNLIDHERLNKAVEASQLSELIEQLPDGLRTVVGERGVLLSGGQRQRVGIARAIYHEREILVFDEATAALDNETESFVTESIKALSGTKTMIIIAHRLSTIEHCDRIYSMENGKIVKSGTYQEVVLDERADAK